MKLKINLFVSLIITGLAYGQASQTENSSGIKANFSQKNIATYQDNSQNKMVEFYEYLTLYSSASDEQLKTQIKENILSLVDSEDILVIDLTSDELPSISLDKFLQKIECKKYQFDVSNAISSQVIGFNEWYNQLDVLYNEKVISLQQQIFFSPNEKNFGSKTQTVWEIKLGEQSK